MISFNTQSPWLLSNQNAYAFPIQFCFFLKIITKISRTLQAVKTCMGFGPFTLAGNQFLLFSQVLSMFEIGRCQSLQSPNRPTPASLPFLSSHPSWKLATLPAPRAVLLPPLVLLQIPHTSRSFCVYQQGSEVMAMLPLWVSHLALLLGFNPTFRPAAALPHTRPAQMLLQLPLHCLPGISAVWALGSFTQEVPNQKIQAVPQESSPQATLSPLPQHRGDLCSGSSQPLVTLPARFPHHLRRDPGLVSLYDSWTDNTTSPGVVHYKGPWHIYTWHIYKMDN